MLPPEAVLKVRNHTFDTNMHAPGGAGILVRNILSGNCVVAIPVKTFEKVYFFTTGPQPHRQQCHSLQTT